MVLVISPEPMVHWYYAQVVYNVFGFATVSVLCIWIAVAFNLLIHGCLRELLWITADGQRKLVLVEHKNIGVDVSLGEAVCCECKATVVMNDISPEVEIGARDFTVS